MRVEFRSYLAARCALLFVALFLTGLAQAATGGVLDEVTGSVSITAPDGKVRKASAKDTVQSGEKITTEAKSEALVKMADNSVYAVRPSTEFKITDYKFEQKPTDSAFVSIFRGTVRMITGAIGKSSPSNVMVNAQTATIGIRGTDFEVAVVTDDSKDTRAGVYDYVRDGENYIQLASNPKESLDVPKEKTGFAPEKLLPGEAPLQLLSEPPAFLLQGGGLDAIIQSQILAPTMIIHQIQMFR